jgi:folate-dependent phosphoribosylglycinamide formyltransferase PurN
MRKKILLVTTLPSKVSNVRIPSEIKLSIFDFSCTPLNKNGFITWLENYIHSEYVEILVTYRCPYIIPSRIIDTLRESVNIHPLALPQFAGLNPWEKFMASGMNHSEAVLHRLSYMADVGEIIMREPFSFTYFSDARSKADSAAACLFEKYLNSVNNL